MSIPGFSNLRRIGVGGSATVYRARQDGFSREVALKVLSFDLVGAKAKERFDRECQAAGSLSGHPNIVTVIEAGVTEGGQPYIAMELLERGSLADVLRLSGPLAPDEVLRLGVKLCGALATAHRAGILHRDLKTENVLISAFGEPALTDFGISTVAEAATATMTSQSMTPVHAPPEVLEDNRATVASDIYSLGSTLYQALAGRAPFASVDDETLLSLMLRVLRDPVPPIGRGDVPPGLEALLVACLAKHPADRPTSAADVGARLQEVQAAVGLPRTELRIGGQDATEAPDGNRSALDERPMVPSPNDASAEVELPAGNVTNVLPGGRAARARAEALEQQDAAPPSEAARRLPSWAIAAIVGTSVLLAGIALLGFVLPADEAKPTPPPTTRGATPATVAPGPSTSAGPTTTTWSVDPNAPTDVKVVAATTTDLQVTWKPPPTFLPAGYIVFLTPSDGTTTHPCGTGDTTGSSCFTTGATPNLAIGGIDAVNRTYCVSVIAFGKTAATAKGFTSPRACTR